MKHHFHLPFLCGLFLALVLPLCTSCSQEDDIDSIFRDGIWYLSNIYVSPGKPALTSDELQNVAQSGGNAYYIQFTGDKFSGKGRSNEFSGIWRVTADRQLFITLQNTGNPSDPTSKLMIEILQQAERYSGDVNNLNIYQKESGRILAFTRKKQ